jgi:hypothetical protein
MQVKAFYATFCFLLCGGINRDQDEFVATAGSKGAFIFLHVTRRQYH